MNHTHAVRITIATGERVDVNFGEIDGIYFDKPGHKLADGNLVAFDAETALLIVNRWNYVGTLQSRIEWVYYLPTVDGAW